MCARCRVGWTRGGAVWDETLESAWAVDRVAANGVLCLGVPGQHGVDPTMNACRSAMYWRRNSSVVSSVTSPSSVIKAGLELDVRLGRVHLRRVAEAEHAAQLLLGDGGADRARRRADHRRRLARERVLAVGPARPVDRVLQAARDRAVVFRRDEQHGIDGRDRILELPSPPADSRRRSRSCRAADP